MLGCGGWVGGGRGLGRLTKCFPFRLAHNPSQRSGWPSAHPTEEEPRGQSKWGQEAERDWGQGWSLGRW